MSPDLVIPLAPRDLRQHHRTTQKERMECIAIGLDHSKRRADIVIINQSEPRCAVRASTAIREMEMIGCRRCCSICGGIIPMQS